MSRLTDFATLCRSFTDAAAGKRAQPEVRAFEYHLEPNILAMRREVLDGRYAWGPYRRCGVSI